MTQGDDINGLFAQFTRLRQLGWSRQQAWAKIEQQTGGLDSGERERLVAMLRSWEAKEGRNYISTPKHDPFELGQRPITGGKPPRTNGASQVQPLTKPVTPSGRRIKRIDPPAGPAQPAQSHGPACPRCGKINRLGELFCADCGAALAKHGGYAGGTLRLTGDAEQDRAHFGENMQVILRVQQTQEIVRVVPRTDDMVIGRASPGSVMIPDIDLSRFDGEALGVSRLHASLRRQGTHIVLTDMGSLNHTYINGQRVHAQEVRVVQDGDELQFGQLRVNVYFEQG